MKIFISSKGEEELKVLKLKVQAIMSIWASVTNGDNSDGHIVAPDRQCALGVHEIKGTSHWSVVLNYWSHM